MVALIAGGLAALVQGLIPMGILGSGGKRLLALGLAVVAGVVATLATPDLSVKSLEDLIKAGGLALLASQTAYALVLSKFNLRG